MVEQRLILLYHRLHFLYPYMDWNEALRVDQLVHVREVVNTLRLLLTCRGLDLTLL